MEFLLTVLHALGLAAALGIVGCAMVPTSITSARTRPLAPLTGIALLSLLSIAWHAVSDSIVLFRIGLLLLFFVGVFRLIKQLKKSPLRLQVSGSIVLLLILLLPIAIKLGVAAFDTNDEIYSWNFWAKQIFLGQSVDYFFTQAPYPTLFSNLVAAIYLLFGTSEMQSVAKLVLWLLPVCVFLLMESQSKSGSQLFVFFVIAILVLYGVGLEKVYATGLADPMMATLLFTGFYCLLHANRISSDNAPPIVWLFLSAIFVALSALTKQAALPWSIVFYPLSLFLYLRHAGMPMRYGFLAFIPIVVSLTWLLTIGAGFQDNPGVIQASTEGRGLYAQLFYAVTQLAKSMPLALALLFYFFWRLVHSGKTYLFLVAFGCFVSLVLWLLFGSYDLRLGMHVFLLLWLASSCVDTEPAHSFFKKHTPYVAILIGLIVLFSGGYSVKKYIELTDHYQTESGEVSYKEGEAKQIVKLFGAGALPILNQLKVNQNRVWVGSNYIYGVLFGSSDILKPVLEGQRPFEYLRDEGVEYVALSHPHLGFGSANNQVLALIDAHPECFIEHPIPANYIGLRVLQTVFDGDCALSRQRS